MRSVSVSSHHMNETFLKKLSDIVVSDDQEYYLVVIPPFIKKEVDILAYFFVKEADDKLKCYASEDRKADLKDTQFSLTGSHTVNILSSRATSALTGFCYIILETDNDIYEQYEIPPLVAMIDEVAQQTDASTQFVLGFGTDAAIDVVSRVSYELSDEEITKQNFTMYVNQMHSTFDDMLVVFQSKPDVSDLPFYSRNRLSLTLFNFVSGLFNAKLYPFFTSLYAKVDESVKSRAAKWIKKNKTSKAPKLASFKEIFVDGKSPVDKVIALCAYFRELVKVIERDDFGVDDILEILPESMVLSGGSDVNFVSMFSYLEVIWPSGLDDEIEYVLATCAAAAKEILSMNN